MWGQRRGVGGYVCVRWLFLCVCFFLGGGFVKAGGVPCRTTGIQCV